MRTEASVTDAGPELAALMRKGVTVAHILQLLQTAYPKNWEQHVRNRLGATDPAGLTPTELAGFTDHVFWLVKQTGIREPASWLAFRAQLDAAVAPAAPKIRSSVEIGGNAGEPKSAEPEPVVTLENSAGTTTASSPRDGSRTLAWGTTKAEVLSGAKAGIEAGESPRDTAERLACAQEDFGASPREIGQAVGRSVRWVYRQLKWRRSGYKQSSAFGPTTRAGRAAHRNHTKNHSGAYGNSEQFRGRGLASGDSTNNDDPVE